MVFSAEHTVQTWFTSGSNCINQSEQTAVRPLIKVILCQVSFASAMASWCVVRIIYRKWEMEVMGRLCRLANSCTGSETYPESVGHLRLPVHRFEEPQVADYPSWGQAKERGVVIQGNLYHGVFRLPTERYTKRSMLP